jgi:hypothetical protein
MEVRTISPWRVPSPTPLSIPYFRSNTHSSRPLAPASIPCFRSNTHRSRHERRSLAPAHDGHHPPMPGQDTCHRLCSLCLPPPHQGPDVAPSAIAPAAGACPLASSLPDVGTCPPSTTPMLTPVLRPPCGRHHHLTSGQHAQHRHPSSGQRARRWLPLAAVPRLSQASSRCGPTSGSEAPSRPATSSPSRGSGSMATTLPDQLFGGTTSILPEVLLEIKGIACGGAGNQRQRPFF